eukprot:TRINITY_DN3948_c0_g1_i2.p1 TRINITY_DN3948_c0_g1~~TRINITY_DN3948_c0_g1_i2.p1  ORF type:complete len:138 (-),score=47.97 TRINITY_DN3948_c0_g1_i2:20-433(-)
MHANKKARTGSLRIREDVPKYLLNLNIDSAYYAPKSRSMRENPLPHLNPEEAVYSGDNFTLSSGDTQEFKKMRRFVSSQSEGDTPVHMEGSPSQTELAYKKDQEKKKEDYQKLQAQIRLKYGVKNESPPEFQDPERN